jgi:glycosyltransferase involved in cell wall biosynthesis
MNKNDTGNQIEFSILIPAFNEANHIIATIEETEQVLEKFNPNYEILVIDDGSIDGTSDVVKTYLKNNNKKVKIESYSPNKGKGFALKYGFGFLSGRYILFLDADLDLHPSHLVDLYEIMKQSHSDVVIGSKQNRGSILNYPKIRKLLSSAYYFLIKVLFSLPIRDTQTGIKLFKYDVLKVCLPKVIVKRYAFDLELLLAVNKKKYKIMEAPINLNAKRKLGRIGLRDAFNVFKDTIGVFWRFYIKRYYN